MQNNQLIRSDIDGFAKTFIESKMFKDVASVAAAAVKIQAGQELGIAPFASMNNIFIIQGKCALGAGIIAALIKSSGKYNYKIKEHNDKICKLEMFENGESQGFTQFTAEDAKRAGTQNMTKFPANMLFARCISNAAKFYCPDIFNGSVYTKEEMQVEDITHEEMPPRVPVIYQSERFSKIKDALIKKEYTLADLEVSYEFDAQSLAEIRSVLPPEIKSDL